MSEARAKLNFIRMSPFKLRMVGNTIKGRKAREALAILAHSPRRAGVPLRKLLESAIANATENHDLDADALVVKNVYVDQGVTMKRWLPRAMGRATPLRKRTAKVTIIVAEEE
jgi:large subunit ribosomal protein L22